MISTIIIFIIILAILVFVHEFGHFIVAKKSGMVVEEFGFGFPPRLVGVQKVDGKWKVVGARGKSIDPNVTIYSINSIPLGGFVRILGENNEQEDQPGSFINKGFWPRLLTLVAGVLMNIILAWVILSIGYIIGLPAAVDTANDIPAHTQLVNPQIAILEVTPGLPADKAGVQPNDILLSINGQTFPEVSGVQDYVKSHDNQILDFSIKRGRQNFDLKVSPNPNPPTGEGPTGIALSLVGDLKYPWYSAVWEGLKSAIYGFGAIFAGIYQLFAQHSGFSALGGPVKIAKLTGQVAGMGFVYLMQFTAFLSLNLAALNILPFPALDGGRVLFLLIEKIRGKRNNQKVEQFVNTVGFIFLLLLMAVVTVHDIVKK